MNNHTSRRLAPKLLGLLLLPLALALPLTPASAHQSSDATPSGRSPFYAGYSFANTGLHYNEAPTHKDYNTRTGQHVNDHYAVDLNPLVNGTCGRHLYAIWGNLTVKTVDKTNGFLKMEGSPTGTGTYQLEYRHMDTIAVSVGQRVARGTFVGTVGQKGFATGCHLHMSTRKSIGGTWYSVRAVVCNRFIADSTNYAGCT
jgi:hypothetical protein